MGFHIELPSQPSIYISGDTIYSADVEKALTTLKADIAVVACGSAELDEGGPILMSLEEIIKFIKKAPKIVFENHMEALNHCPKTRAILKDALVKAKLTEKVRIPNDGETLTFALADFKKKLLIYLLILC